MLLVNHPKLTPQTIPDLEVIMSGAAPIGHMDVDKFLTKYVCQYELNRYICYNFFEGSQK